jgi:hypothetical protein
VSAATQGWVHLTHPDIAGEQLVPDSDDVVEALQARGWVRSDAVPAHLDPDDQGEPSAEPAPEPEAEQPATEDSPAAPGEDIDDPASAASEEE